MRKGTLVYSVILLVILTSLIAFSPPATAIIDGSAKFYPDRIDELLPAPSVVEARIRFESSQHVNPRVINASTIMLEGSLPPDTTRFAPGSLIVEFDGTMVKNIMWGKITHMGTLAPPYKIWLTITGNLIDTEGGRPFSAEGSIKIVVHHSPPTP